MEGWMKVTTGIAALMMIGVLSFHASAHLRPAAKVKTVAGDQSMRSTTQLGRGLTILPADDSGEDDSGDSDDASSEDSQ
jgi:hypothetical protein